MKRIMEILRVGLGGNLHCEEDYGNSLVKRGLCHGRF